MPHILQELKVCPSNHWPAGRGGLARCRHKGVEGTPARVFTAEHLAVIALQTGRAKDKARLLQFIEAGALQVARFQTIVARHGLADAWKRFEKQFLTDGS